MAAASDITLLPDAGPLITLAYADALDVLFKPGWRVAVVDMVQHEVTRNKTPTSARLAKWLRQKTVALVPTQTFAHYQNIQQKLQQETRQSALQSGAETSLPLRKKANLGEMAIQETINALALELPRRASVLLFEDHRIASTNFFLPDGCQKVSTRAFLVFLEQRAYIQSASAIERAAIQAGRSFSQLRFPP